MSNLHEENKKEIRKLNARVQVCVCVREREQEIILFYWSVKATTTSWAWGVYVVLNSIACTHSKSLVTSIFVTWLHAKQRYFI